MTNFRQKLKAFLFLRIALLWKPLISIPEFILAQRKQTNRKGFHPSLMAIISLEEVETEIKKKVSLDTFEKLKSISPQLHKSFRVLNAFFIDIQRTRQGHLSSSLGRHFNPLATNVPIM